MAKLSDYEASLLLKKAGAKPLEPYPGNQRIRWRSECLTCGNEITPRLVNLHFKKACSICRGHNSRSKEELSSLLHKKYLRALAPYPGNTHLPWECQCMKCGLVVSPRLQSLAKGQGGCYRCGQRYDEDLAKIYLVHNRQKKVVKVGITNMHGYRLKDYPGWDIIIVREVSRGLNAKNLETKVLRHWRLEMGLQPAMSREEMPMKGWTETAHESGMHAALEIIQEYQEDFK